MHKRIFVVHGFMFVAFVVQAVVVRAVGDEWAALWLTLLEIETIMVYTYVLITVVRHVGSTSVFMFYHLAFGMFLLSRFVLDLANLTAVEEIDTMISATLPLWAMARTIEAFLLVLIVQTPLYFALSAAIVLKARHLQRDAAEVSVARILFVAATPLFLYRAILEMNAVAATGYAAMYSGGMSQVLELPFALRVSTTVMTAAFLVILKNAPSRREFLVYGCMFLIAEVADMMKGARGMFMVTLVFLLWYHNKTFSAQRIAFRRFLLMAPVLFVVLLFIGARRVNETLEFVDVANMILVFVIGTGSSMLVSALIITWGPAMANASYPYVLDPVVYLYNLAKTPELLRVGQSFEMLAVRNDLGHKVTFFSNPGFYLRGQSIGTSAVAEWLEFGLVGVATGAALWVVFAVLFEKATDRRSQVGLAVLYAYQLFYLIIWAPRNNFLPNSYILLRDGLAVGAIIVAASVVRAVLRPAPFAVAHRHDRDSRFVPSGPASPWRAE
ncbi:MAG: O-antigen polysaccharide polymerase Wzy [Thermoanaerobaculia bacterium]